MSKQFEYGDRVRVTLPGRRPFLGTVYDIDPASKGRTRRVYVDRDDTHVGMSFWIGYVNHTDRVRKKGERTA